MAQLTRPLPAQQKLLPWLQALRAVAAVCVAFMHLTNDEITNGGDPAGVFSSILKSMPWEAGVDIFFVISGFVMIHASASLFGRPGGVAIFLRRRLSRIAPLYWIMTTAFLAVLWVSHASIHGDIGGAAYIVASYLFIPWPRPDGLMQPAFGLGWTLNYEIFFYAILAPCLLLSRRPAVIVAAGLLCLFVAAGHWIGFRNVQLAFWSNPIILEFIAGMAIALCFATGVKLSIPARLGLVAIGIAALHFSSLAPAGWRAVVYGLPATALVGAATLGGTPSSLNRIETWLVRLGDASYAMYLVHPFVMRFFTGLWHKFYVVNEISGTIYVVTGLVAAQLLALGMHATLEVKLSAVLRGRAKVSGNEAF